MKAYMRIDPRGPLRRIITIQESVGPTLVEKDCGHVSEYANHFTYAVGHLIHCFDCRDTRDNTKQEYC